MYLSFHWDFNAYHVTAIQPQQVALPNKNACLYLPSYLFGERGKVIKNLWRRGEVNEAITVMDYTESQDAVLYPLSAGALRSLEEKKKQLVSLFLPLSVFLRSPLIRHRALFPPLPVHVLWCWQAVRCLDNRNHNFFISSERPNMSPKAGNILIMYCPWQVERIYNLI